MTELRSQTIEKQPTSVKPELIDFKTEARQCSDKLNNWLSWYDDKNKTNTYLVAESTLLTINENLLQILASVRQENQDELYPGIRHFYCEIIREIYPAKFQDKDNRPNLTLVFDAMAQSYGPITNFSAIRKDLFYFLENGYEASLKEEFGKDSPDPQTYFKKTYCETLQQSINYTKFIFDLYKEVCENQATIKQEQSTFNLENIKRYFSTCLNIILHRKTSLPKNYHFTEEKVYILCLFLPKLRKLVEEYDDYFKYTYLQQLTVLGFESLVAEMKTFMEENWELVVKLVQEINMEEVEQILATRFKSKK